MSRGQTLALLCLFLVTIPSWAHPVPRDNHDRTLVVRMTTEAVVVDYRLEVDEFRATRDLPPDELGGISSREGFHAAFARFYAGFLGNNLVATLDGKPLEFACISERHQFLDHVRCDFRFRAPWKLDSAKAHRFTFRESNYETDGFSLLHVSLDGGDELTLRDIIAPDVTLLERPADQRKPGDGERLRKVSATVLAVPSFLPGLAHPALPPDPEPARDAASGRQRGMAAHAKTAPSYPVGTAKSTPPPDYKAGVARDGPSARPAAARSTPAAADGEAAPESHGKFSLLDLLLDTRRGMAMMLLLAAGFGAAHALTPGHGKTLVAAYLVGQRGTIGHALVLGLVTTLTHTGGVILLALVMALWFRDANPAAMQSVLGLVGGLLVAGLGLWLLLQRLTGRADHFHLGGGHDHHHHGESVSEGALPRANWWQVVLLGVAGGIVPCWDAIVIMLWVISVQRLWMGVPLLLAFSAGLASVLVALGIAVVRAGQAADARLGDSERYRKLVRVLPIISAAVITALGLFLTFSAVRAAG